MDDKLREAAQILVKNCAYHGYSCKSCEFDTGTDCAIGVPVRWGYRYGDSV